jgi:hypothetical protein
MSVPLSLSVAVSEAFVPDRPALRVDALGRDDLGEPVGGDPDLPLAVVDEPVVAPAGGCQIFCVRGRSV